jgi:hypothetical protein
VRWLGSLFSFIGRFGCIVQVCAAIFLIGVLLWLVGLVVGFSLGDVDAWLRAHGGLFNMVGTVLFRIGCGFVLLCCVAAVLSALFERARTPETGAAPETDPDPSKPSGLGCAFVALVVGYFAWIGMVR